MRSRAPLTNDQIVTLVSFFIGCVATSAYFQIRNNPRRLKLVKS